MVVLSYRIIREYCAKHPDALDALNNWYRFVEAADWGSFNSMRRMVGSVDAVGNDLYVFNIRGNKYRLVVRIIFFVRTVFIRFVGSHEEYDRLNFEDL